MTAEHGGCTRSPPSALTSLLRRGAFTDLSLNASERESARPPLHATQIGTGSDCQLQAKSPPREKTNVKKWRERRKELHVDSLFEAAARFSARLAEG